MINSKKTIHICESSLKISDQEKNEGNKKAIIVQERIYAIIIGCLKIFTSHKVASTIHNINENERKKCSIISSHDKFLW